MKSYLLDTNVLLRYLVGDNQEQHKRATEWFKQAEKGKIKIVVTSLSVAETCFVLESFYKKSREEITDAMTVFLSQRWLSVPDRQTLLGMWDNYLADLHFVDAFLLSKANVDRLEVMTFDEKVLKKISQRPQ